ncbi:glycosyltransferase [Litchfieldia alkalitelluris]|uniref:glycosyltransferase n=1 Tax=Litchfieldia alkalitelluris TaxID=304268 RepID=UPI0009960FA6|nr:glycosyltransferase [Litchfieldia alkalitelluris]
MKKTILFVIDSLECAGAEKSLVTLLGLLDYTKYEVDLMMFGHGGGLEEFVPRDVNILPPLTYTEFSNLSIKKALFFSLKNFEFRKFASRINYSTSIRINKYKNSEKARIYWQSVSSVIEENPKEYDIAISYAQGVPTFYVAEKIKAKKKLAWVNVSYRLNEKDKKFQEYFYNNIDRIVAVSDSTRKIFLETFPVYNKKTTVLYDIVNPDLIFQMAEQNKGFNDGFNGLKILTIGRLDYQKGYDIALEACKLMKEKGMNFRWYVLGKGKLQKDIEDYIKINKLANHFILLGTTGNPYPYIKKADIYVQTSKFEGFGLAIAEARILNTPVVTTRFDAVYNQMIDNKNGLVVNMDGKSVSEGIIKLVKNKRLRTSIVKYLQIEKKGNTEDINKFYQLIG